MAHTDGKVYLHRAALYNKIGPGKHRCHKCKRWLWWGGKGMRRLNVDHMDSDRWNNKPKNLKPVCRWCNSKRATNPNFLTHCRRGHEFTPENTYYRPDGKGKIRLCRTCNRAANNARRRRLNKCP